jgi:hypothetical protein
MGFPPARSKARTQRGVVFAALLLLVFLMLQLLRPVQLPSQHRQLPIGRQEQLKVLDPESAPLQTAAKVTVGMYLENAYNLSVADQTFMANGWYWLDWPAEVQKLLEENKVKADELVQVVNNIVGYDFEIETESEEPELKPNGWRHQRFQFSGHFYIDELDLHESPFSLLSLPLMLEVRPAEFALNGDEPLVLVPEKDHSGLVGGFASIRGFNPVGVSFGALQHTYATAFGEDSGPLRQSQVTLRVFYQTPVFSAFLQWILPLLIVMAVVFLAPSLEGSLGDLRIAIPSTALLTLVVMQQTYQAELPPLSYLTFLDKLYLYSYLVSIGLFVLFVWGSNVYATAQDDQRDQAVAKVERADSWFQVISLGGLLVVAWLSWTLAR